MSQYNFSSRPERLDVMFGFDHALGYFVTVFKPNTEEDEALVDLCSLFNGLTGPQLVEEVENYNPPQGWPLRERQSGESLTWEQIRSRAFLDLAF